MTTQPATRTKPQPILAAMAILAGVDVFVGGSALADLLDKKLAGLMLLGMAAVKVGTAYYLRGLVVPLVDTAAYVDDTGQMVAGPASPISDKTPVDVVEQ